jgi:hypothetical protein
MSGIEDITEQEPVEAEEGAGIDADDAAEAVAESDDEHKLGEDDE